MKRENHFYDGVLYQIEFQPQLSNYDYTKHLVYYIQTEDEDYPHAKRAIASIMEDLLSYEQGEIWSEGMHAMQYKNSPSILNALHPYYKFSYNEEFDVYEYIFVEPYDD